MSGGGVDPGGVAALLIDLDDTLFPESAWNDSGLRAASLALAGETGLDTEEVLSRLRYEQQREGRAGAFERACAWFAVDPGAADAMEAAWRGHAPALRLYDGAAEALAALRDRFRLAVVAYGDGARIKALVLRLDQRVDAVVLCDDAGCAGPPRPDCLALAAARLGVAPGACLVVGDDPYLDGMAARALDAPFCRVLTGRFADVEAGPEPALRIARFADLPAALA